MAGNDPRNRRDDARDGFDADEDPLVELARIVSEDGGFSSRVNQRPRVERARPTADHGEVSSDLEAELLQELETSFSARKPEPTAPEVAAQQAAPEPPAPRAPPEFPPAQAASELPPSQAAPEFPPPQAAPEFPPPQAASEFPPRQVAAEPDPPQRVVVEPPTAAREPLSEELDRVAPPVDEPAQPEQRQEPSFAPPPRLEPDDVSPPPPRAAPKPVTDNGDPEDLLRSIEEQLSRFDQRARTEGYAAPSNTPEEDEQAWAATVMPADEPDPAPSPEWLEPQEPARPEYSFRGPAGAEREGSYDAPPDDALPTEAPVAAVEEVVPPPEPAPVPPAAAAPDVADEPMPAREAPPRREVPPPPAEARRAPTLVNLEDELAAEFVPGDRSRVTARQPEPVAVQPQATAPAPEPEPASESEEDDAATVAVAAALAPQHAMRPPPRPAAPPPKRSRRGLMTAAAVLVVVALGGAAAFYMRAFDSAPSGPPPVIAAQDGPVKIEPAESQADGEQVVGEAVYDRVAGRTDDAEETVVEGAEEPREIARIVLPEAESTVDAPLAPADSATGEAMAPAEGEVPPATASVEPQGSQDDFGPRRVNTFVVRPDGTVVETAEVGETAEPDLSGQQMATAQTEAMEPKPVQTVTIEEPRTAGTPTQPAAEGTTITGQDAASPAAEETTELPAEVATAEPATEPAAEAPAAQEVAVAPQAVEQPAAQTAPPATASAGFLVQIASQTSREAALSTFASLQRRYSAVLGNLEADIQRADLGERGIYYRVRVGPWAQRDDAVGVCEALKSAGGDCFVAR